jgi:hypothetical protein
LQQRTGIAKVEIIQNEVIAAGKHIASQVSVLVHTKVANELKLTVRA